MSPLMHNAAFESLGIQEEFVFEKQNVLREELADFVARVRQKEFAGVSVTMPHKKTIIPLLDDISREAMLAQAVNTVTWTGDTLTGHNTDGAGCAKALEAAGISIKGKVIVILGAGGAGRAIAISLASKGAGRIHILNRTPIMAEDVAEVARYESASEVAASGLDSIEKALAGANILINATPVGTMDTIDKTVVPPGLLRPNMTVLDLVYEPARTQLVRDAKKAGAKIIPGIEMLLQQGALQFKLFTGKDAPLDVMRAAINIETGGLNR